jgi:hypothetical protein
MGFVDTFRELFPGKIKYSFWDIRDKSRKENKGWRLDYFLVSKQIMHAVVDAEIHNEFWGSDHCPVSLTIDCSKINLEEFREYQRLGAQDNADADKDELDMEDPLNEERKSDLEDDPIDEEAVNPYHFDEDEDEEEQGSFDDDDRIDDPEREMAELRDSDDEIKQRYMRGGESEKSGDENPEDNRSKLKKK